MGDDQVQNFTVYGADEVRAWLDYEGCIGAMRDAMMRFTADTSEQPLRTIITLAPGKQFGLMPGALPAPDAFGAKIVSVFGDPDRPGRSAHRGVVVAFDRDSGDVTCIADAGEITHIRTAAATAMATDVLARQDAARLAIFGSGAQAETHIRALACVRQFDEVVIWGRSVAAAERLAERMAAETGLSIRAEGDARRAAQADVICTVTGSATPVLLGEWVAPGTHVNAVGSSRAGPVEVDSALVLKSRYIADSVCSALAAAAEFLVAKDAGLLADDHIAGEIGDVLLGRIAGRSDATEITFYKSLGHVAQDLAAAHYLHARAQAAAA